MADVIFIDIRQFGLKPRPFNLFQLFFADEICQFCAFAIRLLLGFTDYCSYLAEALPGWWFQILFIFTTTWRNDPI